MDFNFDINLLKNPIILALICGILVTLYLYVDSSLITKQPKSRAEYIRNFIISSGIFAILLPFYHIPKRIFKEEVTPGPAPF